MAVIENASETKHNFHEGKCISFWEYANRKVLNKRQRLKKKTKKKTLLLQKIQNNTCKEVNKCYTKRQ